jgi:hypothetical protein
MTDTAPPGLTPADITAADDRAKQLAYLLKGLVRELCGWGAWISDTGVLYASRDRGLSETQLAGGLAMTVHGADPRELAEQIREQASLEAKVRAQGKAPAA